MKKIRQNFCMLQTVIISLSIQLMPYSSSYANEEELQQTITIEEIEETPAPAIDSETVDLNLDGSSVDGFDPVEEINFDDSNSAQDTEDGSYTDPYVENDKAAEALFALYDSVAPKNIGVILPLTGSISKQGKLAEQYVKFAQSLRAKNIEVIIKDSRSTVEGSIKAVEELVKKDKAIAIIAPLLNEGLSKAAAETAIALQTPLISVEYGNQLKLSQNSRFLFHFGLSYDAQIDALLAAIKPTTSAVVFPKTPLGEDLNGRFSEKYQKKNGKLQKSVAVSAGELNEYLNKRNDLLVKVQVKGGNLKKALEACENQEPTPDMDKTCKGQSNANQASYEYKVKSCLESYLVGLRTKCKKSVKENSLALAPNYNDVFMPMLQPSAASNFFEALTYLESPKTKVRILGLDFWNAPALMQLPKKHLENIVFTAGFNSQEANVKAFIDRFKQSFKKTPNTSTALVIDAILLADHIVSNLYPRLREEFSASMLDLENPELITGPVQFHKDGSSEKKVYLFTIKGGKIVEIPRAKE